VLTTDPINLPVRQRMIELKLAHARKQIQSSRADLAVRILAEAAEWERPEAPSAALRIGAALAAMAAGQENTEPDALRASVREAGGGAVLWFHVAVEASLMRLPERLLAQYQQELETARQSEPTRTMILALASLLGQREIRSNWRAIAPAMRCIQPFLERGSSIAWSAAEFQMIGDLLAGLRAFRVLQRYASDALRREVDDPTARFYQVVARAEGNRDRLAMDQESKLLTLASEAAERHDFHLLNRIQRFLLGPAATRARRLRSQVSMEPGALSEIDMAELMAMLADSAPVLPPKEVRAMVRELGRDVAVEMLTASMADSPMANAMSEAQMAQLCAALVAQALDHRPWPARRH
jgi:hypothetical protein